MWKAPLTTVMRSGFEITGYAMNRGLATWAAPAVQRQTRSGFEITGYAMNRGLATWAAPAAQVQRSGFEVTGYFNVRE